MDNTFSGDGGGADAFSGGSCRPDALVDSGFSLAVDSAPAFPGLATASAVGSRVGPLGRWSVVAQRCYCWQVALATVRGRQE